MSRSKNEFLKKIPGAALSVVGFAARAIFSSVVILWVYALVTFAHDDLLRMSWGEFRASPLTLVAIAINVGALMPFLAVL
ncbi:MAG: hypothetical protein JSR90_24920 [Proteobacteria bacterium]|nr:hypothetical protein [Pseudomonadota bacterium]